MKKVNNMIIRVKKDKNNPYLVLNKTCILDKEISAKAMFYIERHYLSHSLQLADALIASTAITNGLQLLTGNEKHYKVIKELSITKFKPSR